MCYLANLAIFEINNIIFSGNVSLENNGGFASIRRGFDGSQLKESSVFLLRVKGDGNIYKFRLTMKGSYANYSADFKTTKDQWMDIEIPVESFKPYYFGRSIRAPKLKVHKVNSIGILILLLGLEIKTDSIMLVSGVAIFYFNFLLGFLFEKIYSLEIEK